MDIILFYTAVLSFFIQPLLAIGMAVRAFRRMGKFPAGGATADATCVSNLFLGLAGAPLFCTALWFAAVLRPPELVLGMLALMLLPILPALTPLGKIPLATPLLATIAALPVPLLFFIAKLMEISGRSLPMLDFPRC